MSKKTWLIFAAICVAILGSLVWLSKSKQLNVDAVDILAIQAPSDQNGNIGDHVFGNKDAKVRLIEYGDFQCPGCRDAAPVLKEISEKYKADVAFIYRNFPLAMHGNARTAAATAEAAGLQGKYWEMHDKLFSTQDEWSELSGSTRLDAFTNYATGLGLDKQQFLNDIEGSRIAAKIAFDQALGSKAGVTGTPTIFVNGKKVSDLRSNGKVITTDKNDSFVWASPDLFEKMVIIPALKEAGVSTNKYE